MKNIYFSTSLMWGHSAGDILAFAREEDVEGVEVWHQQFLTADSETINLLKRQREIKTTVHAVSWDLNFGSEIPEIRKTSLDVLKSSILFTRKIGAKEVTIHPGRMTVPNTYEVAFEKVAQGVRELVEYGKKNHVLVSMEIMESLAKEVIVTFEDVKRLAKECPESVFTLDIAHCDSLELMYSILESDIPISKFHVSNRKGKVLHTPLAQGDYPMREIVSMLQQYNKPIVIEGFDRSREIELLRENIHYLKTFKGDLREQKISSNHSKFIDFGPTGGVFLEG